VVAALWASIELPEQRGGYALDRLHLLGVEVFTPRTRRRLSIELARSLLLLEYGLPIRISCLAGCAETRLFAKKFL
jgi:hypothetical protein